MCSDGTGPPQEPCEHQAGHNGEAGAGPGQRGEALRAAIADTKTGNGARGPGAGGGWDPGGCKARLTGVGKALGPPRTSTDLTFTPTSPGRFPVRPRGEPTQGPANFGPLTAAFRPPRQARPRLARSHDAAWPIAPPRLQR